MRVTKEEKLRSLKPYFSVTNMWSVDDVKRKHCGHWFDKDTMRFFKSRLVQDVFPTDSGRVYFVSSEQGPDNVRKFSIRCYTIAGDDISTVGEFNSYVTKTQALSAALDCAYNAVKGL